MTERIYMWMDQNVDKMSREEAIEALKLCGRLLEQTYEHNHMIMDILKIYRLRSKHG